jgi:adenylate cyclase
MPGIDAKSKHPITVLLVDDQPIVAEMVRQMLAGEEDISFHYCQDPTQAISTANEIAPTVILQDLVMPEMDGLTLVRFMRANAATREVPLIVLSSKEEAETKAEAFALGANDYMVKLPEKPEVVARLRYHSRGYIALLERNEAYAQLEKANRFIRKTFGRYLSDEVVDSILESPEGAALGGEKRDVTIMMTDLRGFTSIAERLPAEEVVDIINIYLETMTEIILRYNGTIDEFIGDAIFVIFGAPGRRDDDAPRAVACALEMELAMTQVKARCRERGYPEVEQGIGINTGAAVVGNIGSSKRTKYGVVGRNVNLTARIESYTVGGQIFVSESTRRACGEALRIDDQMEVMPKGVAEPITIYQVGAISGPHEIALPEPQAAQLRALEPPLPLHFTVLAGKHAGEEAHAGDLISLGDKVAVVASGVVPDRLANVKIALADAAGTQVCAEVYAKVVALEPEQGHFRVHFTSLPPEARTFLEGTV